MTDLVVGLGEIGSAIKTVLQDGGFNVDGYDIKEPCRVQEKYDFVHICIPGDTPHFKGIIEKHWLDKGKVVIHSTVEPGTSDALGVVYSPVRGVHSRMVKDLKRYTKYYSGLKDVEFEKRFNKCKNVPYSTTLELTKIFVDTTYYGMLIAYQKHVDKNFNVYWDFAEEINEFLHNRPIMTNNYKEIGGHCVLPNLDLESIPIITDFIRSSYP